MFRQSHYIKRWGPLLLWMPLLVKAETATAPSAEFWQYLVEFSDEQGELMDPEDLAAVGNLTHEDTLAVETATASKGDTIQHSSSAKNSNSDSKEANL